MSPRVRSSEGASRSARAADPPTEPYDEPAPAGPIRRRSRAMSRARGADPSEEASRSIRAADPPTEPSDEPPPARPICPREPRDELA